MKKLILFLTLFSVSIGPIKVEASPRVKAFAGLILVAGGGVGFLLGYKNKKFCQKKLALLKKYVDKFESIKKLEKKFGPTEESEKRKKELYKKFKKAFADEIKNLQENEKKFASIEGVLQNKLELWSLEVFGSYIAVGLGICLFLFALKEKGEEEDRRRKIARLSKSLDETIEKVKREKREKEKQRKRTLREEKKRIQELETEIERQTKKKIEESRKKSRKTEELFKDLENQLKEKLKKLKEKKEKEDRERRIVLASTHKETVTDVDKQIKSAKLTQELEEMLDNLDLD